MTTKRIRCTCGRVYDPVKRPVCPDCGAPHVVAEPAVETNKEKPSPAPRPTPISPRSIAIGAGVVFVLIIVFALTRCGSKEGKKQEPLPSPTPASTTAPSQSPTPRQTPTPPPSIIVPPPPTSPTPALGLTSDLAAMIANAESGATIKIPPGVYPGGLVVNRSIRLVGASGQVFIQSDGRECLTVRAAGVSVQNIQFTCNGIGELPAISVADGAGLELEGCKIQANTAVGLTAIGTSTLKTLGCNFSAPNGVAVRLTQGARGEFTQSSFNESRLGFWLAQAATAELHSCAFERNGGSEAKGAIISLNHARTTLTADDCHFTSNAAGISAVSEAALTITNCSFNNNGVTPRGAGVVGLIALYNNASGTISGSTFETNQQGVSVSDGSKLEMTKCQFTGSGVAQMREVIPSCQPISVFGKSALASVRSTVIYDSAQYGAVVMGGGKIEMEEVEILGARTAGVVVGDRAAGPGEAVIKRCRFRNNGTGFGVFAASNATVEEAEFRENQDGIIVLDKDSHVRGERLNFTGNTDAGLFARLLGNATVTASDFINNARGVAVGVKGRSTERASIALEDCRFSGNRIFGAGACAQSELNLLRCNFDGTDKQNIFKERSAIVRSEVAGIPSPTPGSSAAEQEASPSPADEEVDASPSPGSRRPKPRPRPRPRRGNEVERFLRDVFGPR